MIEIYQAEINRLDQLIQEGMTAELQLREAASAWKKDAETMKIRGGNKKAGDTADRERKFRKFEDYIRLANQKAQEVEDLRILRRKQMDLKESAQITENDVSNILANKGFTRDTLAIKETSIADITRLKGEADASNVLKLGDEAVKRAQIDNKAKNNQVILISAASAIVLIIVSIIAFKKYKSKSKK